MEGDVGLQRLRGHVPVRSGARRRRDHRCRSKRARCGCWPTAGWLPAVAVIDIERGDLRPAEREQAAATVRRRRWRNRGAVPRPACAEAPSRWLHDRSEGPDPQRSSWRALREASTLPSTRRCGVGPGAMGQAVRGRSRAIEEAAARPDAQRERPAGTGDPGAPSAGPIGCRRRQGRRCRPDWVERFAPPVFAEMAQVVAPCRAPGSCRARLGPRSTPIGESSGGTSPIATCRCRRGVLRRLVGPAARRRPLDGGVPLPVPQP